MPENKNTTITLSPFIGEIVKNQKKGVYPIASQLIEQFHYFPLTKIQIKEDTESWLVGVFSLLINYNINFLYDVKSGGILVSKQVDEKGKPILDTNTTDYKFSLNEDNDLKLEMSKNLVSFRFLDCFKVDGLNYLINKFIEEQKEETEIWKLSIPVVNKEKNTVLNSKVPIYLNKDFEQAIKEKEWQNTFLNIESSSVRYALNLVYDLFTGNLKEKKEKEKKIIEKKNVYYVPIFDMYMLGSLLAFLFSQVNISPPSLPVFDVYDMVYEFVVNSEKYKGTIPLIFNYKKSKTIYEGIEKQTGGDTDKAKEIWEFYLVSFFTGIFASLFLNVASLIGYTLVSPSSNTFFSNLLLSILPPDSQELIRNFVSSRDIKQVWIPTKMKKSFELLKELVGDQSEVNLVYTNMSIDLERNFLTFLQMAFPSLDEYIPYTKYTIPVFEPFSLPLYVPNLFNIKFEINNKKEIKLVRDKEKEKIHKKQFAPYLSFDKTEKSE